MSSKSKGNNDVTQKLFVEAGTGIGHEKDGQRRCLGCMELYSEEYEVCPYCGYTIEEEVENALHMFPGTVLYDKYIIGRVIGYGGFGVTYLAWDTVLQIKVAIKEYLPSEFSTRAAGQTQITVFSGDKTKQFNDGMEKFVDEAKRLAKFRSENGIVKIFDSFSENGTAYIAMEYLQGETLAERLEREKTIPIEESIQMLMPIIESLNKVHDEGIIHRDIAPDNIFLTNKGEVKLIDFGASRYATTSRSRSLTVIIKPGFSAEEQYRSRGDQGPHTDVYSVGACLYKMITGQAPPDAMERRALFEKNGRDMLVPIKKFIKDIDPRRENAIYNALNIRIEDRTPDMISLAGELLSEEPVKKRRSGIKKIDPLTWPLWAKIGIPTGLVAAITLCVLFAFGIIGPKSDLETRFVVPEGQTLIPNVVAGSLEDAKKKLKDENLNWQIAGKVISTVIDRDLVLRQEPDAFNVVDQGTIIDIIISDGHGMGTVPDVIGLTIELATEKLKEAGYKVKTIQKSSDIYASGAVIEQEYEAGTMLEKENEIQLTVSTGPEGIDRTKVVTVPSILGMDYEEAKKLLADFKLFPAVDEEVYNASIPDNQIMGQNPLANTQAHQGDTIYVTVNRGTKTVYVPDVVNKTLENALLELENAGLNVSTKEAQNSEYAPGVVFQQSIKPGTSVTIGTTVTVTVSSGFKVKVPDLTGQRSATAQQTLVNAGLAASITTEPSDSVAKDRVITHDYIGEEVERGTTITLVVSSGRDRTNSGGNNNSGNSGEEKNEAPVASLVSLKIKSRPAKTEYFVGDSLDTSGLKVTAVYSDDTEKDVTSNCHVLDADLSNAGNVSVKVTYEDNGIEKTASFSVNVIKPSVKIDSSYSIVVNQTITLSATTKPDDLSVSWSVDDEKIATVDDNKLKGVKAGRTRITATVSHGGQDYTTSATVNVSDGKIPVEKVVLDITSLELRAGGKQTLKVTPYPANATSPKYTWTSNNTSVANVTANGEVMGVGAGNEAIITVTEAGGAKATCKVTVKKAEIDHIQITKKPDKLVYFVGEKVDIKGIEIKAFYKVGSPVTVDTSKLKVNHAKFTEKRTYEVSVTYEGKSASFPVEVKDARLELKCPVDMLTTKGSNTAQLVVDVKPESLKGDVKFESENNCAKVDSKGVVTALKAGTAKITASVKFGNELLTDTVSIKIIDLEVKEIKIKKVPSKKEYYIGDTIDTSGMTIERTYSDGSKDVINPDGSTTVKFKKSGKTVLTKEDISGGKAEVVVTYKGVSKAVTFSVTAKTPSVDIDIKSCELQAGGSEKQINVKNYSCGDNYEISWETSNASVATVSKKDTFKGSIKGVAQGTAEIKAVLTYKGNKYYSAACKVTVKGATVTGVSVAQKPKETSYYNGDKLNTSGLTLEIKYSNGETKKVTNGFTCEPTNLTNEGTQKITVKYGDKTTSFDITVKTPKVTKFGYLGTTLTTANNSSMEPDIKLEPEDGWTLKYSSSNKCVNVEATGIVTGQEPGSSVITLTATRGSHTETKTVSIEVINDEPTDFEIKNGPTGDFKIGDTVKGNDFKLTVYYGVGDKDGEDTSANIKAVFKSQVRGTDNSATLTPAHISGGGKALVVVSYGNLTKTENHEVNVTLPTVKISPEKLELDAGETASSALKATVSNAGNYGYKIEWKSSNTSVATVDDKGKVTAGSSSGTAEIYAVLKYNDNPGLKIESNRITVTVSQNPPEIELETGSIEMTEGDETKISISKLTNADSGSISWESDKTSVASVSGSGETCTVKAKSEGTAKIRAVVTVNGTKYYSDWCTVTVTKAETEPESSSEEAQAVDLQDS